MTTSKTGLFCFDNPTLWASKYLLSGFGHVNRSDEGAQNFTKNSRICIKSNLTFSPARGRVSTILYLKYWLPRPTVSILSNDQS